MDTKLIPETTNSPCVEVLRQLVEERGLSFCQLAKAASVSQPFLSQALSRRKSTFIRGNLAGRLAVALELPRDFFPEYREHYIAERIRESPSDREWLYAILTADKPQPTGTCDTDNELRAT